MNRSGMKRGLAVTAISALALTGLAMTPAQAATINQKEAALQLYTQEGAPGSGASIRNDGANTTVTVLAGTPTLIGGVTVNAIRFSYLKGGVATPINTINGTAVLNGLATVQWTPPANPELSQITGMRAEALDAGGNVLATDDNAITGATIPTANAVSLAGATRSDLGYGPDGEVVVTGGTTEIASTTVQNVGPDAAGAAVGATATGAPDGNNVTPYAAIVPIDPTNQPVVDVPTDLNDEVILRAAVGAGAGASDDAQAYTIYRQTVGPVTTPLAPGSSVNVQAGGVADDTKYNITVLDQRGLPIQGLNVFETDTTADGETPNAAGNGTPDTGETNTAGVFQATLNEATIDNANDRDPAANSQSTFYVVDVNQNGVYNSGVDFRFELKQTRFTAVPTTITITPQANRGTAIDDDETNTLTVNVKDQNGNPILGVSPVLTETATRTDLNPDGAPVVTQTTLAATDASGNTTYTGVNPQADFGDDNAGTYKIDAYVNNNGTPAPDAGDAIAAPLTIESDRAYTKWNSGTTAQAANGTTTVQTGSLVLPSGAKLAGRTITLDLTRTTDVDPSTPGNQPGNAILAPQAQQPAGTTRGSDLQASAVTNAAGEFAVAVTDPAAPNGQELNDTLSASNSALEITPANDATDDLDGTNADGRSYDLFFGLGLLDLDFLRSLTPARVEIHRGFAFSTNDGLPAQIGTAAQLQPGSLGAGNVSAYNADNVLLDDVSVQLTIEQGEFVNPSALYEGTPTPGAPVDFKGVGKTITVSTGDSGQGIFLANIERNAGFDDDGLVQDNITATVGTNTDEHDLTWSTQFTPLNPRATSPLVVELSEDQESTILPKARAGNTGVAGNPYGGTGQTVDYDVETYDQFGNPTSQPLNVTDNSPLATATGVASAYVLNQPAVQATATTTTSQVIEVELQGARTYRYIDNPSNSAFNPAAPQANLVSQPVEIQDTTDAIAWYALDYAASRATMTLGQQGPDTVPAGSAVTEVLTALDQEGQAITGMPVGFLRVGPSDDGDSDGNANDFTNESGQAFYDFAGNVAGTATVNAVIYNDQGIRQYTVGPDNVTFTGTQPGGPAKISPKATGKDKGRRDQITVKATKAFGATVQLFKFVNGKRSLVKTSSLNAQGVKVFTVADKNGSKVTRYFAVIKATARTKSGTTSIVRVK